MDPPQGSHSLLLRWIDDFLYISTDENLAREFAKTTHAGIPEYGCECNMAKSRVNFPCDITLPNSFETKTLPLCRVFGAFVCLFL